MNRMLLLLLITISLLAVHCSTKDRPTHLVIERMARLDSVPSGSGMALKDSFVYIVTDDGTGIYRFAKYDSVALKIPLMGMIDTQYREHPLIKHDYEAAAIAEWNGENRFLAFGSGSKHRLRDSMLVLSLADYSQQQTISLTDFYTQLMQLTKTDAKKWNIEGAVTVGDQLYLCNRGENHLIQFSVKEFKQYLAQPGSPFPTVQYYPVDLPTINGKQARLSGACALDSERLIFCASVEDTEDWTANGAILGSFVLEYSLRKKAIIHTYPLTDEKGVHLPEKLEALEVLDTKGKNEFTLLAVTDNDDGTSNLFWLGVRGK